jgi:hypothetical protein
VIGDMEEQAMHLVNTVDRLQDESSSSTPETSDRG